MSGASIRIGNRIVYQGADARAYIWARDGHHCHYCRIKLPKPRRDHGNVWNIATIDHILPTSKGGSRADPNNMVLSCRRCNDHRGDGDFHAYVAFWRSVVGPWTPLFGRWARNPHGIRTRHDLPRDKDADGLCRKAGWHQEHREAMKRATAAEAATPT